MTAVESQPFVTGDSETRDLAMAGQLQRMLLPPSPLAAHGWTAVHRFVPSGTVSGDYVDLVRAGNRLYFMLGDVSGKGIAASLVMAQLHAMFRSLIPFGLPIDELMQRASALLCASSLPTQYATLVCGYADPTGEVVISNAGHPPALVLTADGRVEVPATGVPIGLFCESEFTATHVTLGVGDTLLAYTDGLSEAPNALGEEYGRPRIEMQAAAHARNPLDALVNATLGGLASFQNDGDRQSDDVTILALRRTATESNNLIEESLAHRRC